VLSCQNPTPLFVFPADAPAGGGITANTFGPDNTCTRGQIVTFLYRAFGK